MGCGASTPTAPKGEPPLSKPELAKKASSEHVARHRPVSVDPTASEKLRVLLGGVEVEAKTWTEENAEKAHATICAQFAAKMNGRTPTKPIDLTHFYEGAERVVSPALLAALKEAVGKEMADALGAALETLWQRVLPKIGIGTMGLTAKVKPEQQPLKVAYDHGVRLFPLMDPMKFMGPMGEKMNNLKTQGNDLRECDLSTDAFISSAPAIFIKADSTPEEARGCVRRSFDALREELGALKTGEGQPYLDSYALFFPTLVGLPSKVPLLDVLPIGEVWAEFEALVDEGLVRGLGISNFTTHQIDALLSNPKVRHRPSWIQQERHVLNQIDDFKAFCDARKLPLMAAIPLATGDVLDSKHLAHPEMTPAQAALHWNITQGVAVIPGADCIEHIIENAATASKLHITPITAPEPAEPLRKVYPLWPAMADLFFETGTAADRGAFVTGDDGILRCAKRELAANDPRAAEGAKIDLTPAEVTLLKEVAGAIQVLTLSQKPDGRRAALDGAIRQSRDDAEGTAPAGVPAPDRRPSMMTNLTAAAKESSSDGVSIGLYGPKDGEPQSHTIAPRAAGGNLAPMVVVPFPAFVDAGKIPRRSVKEGEPTHVAIDEVGEGGKVLFISQRWLTPKPAVGRPSPDDAELTKYTAVVKAAKAWAAREGVAEEKLYIWIDYSSVDQDDLSELTKGVNSLGLFVCSADAFITIEHPDYFDRGWCLLECVFADASKVPRFVMTAGGDLKKETAEDRVALKKPHEGSFTVEADRGFMKQLEAAATFIKGQIERGFFEVDDMINVIGDKK